MIAREELEHELDSKNHTIRMLQKQLVSELLSKLNLTCNLNFKKAKIILKNTKPLAILLCLWELSRQKVFEIFLCLIWFLIAHSVWLLNKYSPPPQLVSYWICAAFSGVPDRQSRWNGVPEKTSEISDQSNTTAATKDYGTEISSYQPWSSSYGSGKGDILRGFSTADLNRPKKQQTSWTRGRFLLLCVSRCNLRKKRDCLKSTVYPL